MASANTWKGIIAIIALILKPILSVVTPLIKEFFEDGLKKLLAKARATENPVDDLFVELLFNLLGLPIPPDEE